MSSTTSESYITYKRPFAAAHWMLTKIGSCFTGASLSGVRRIRASSGNPGRSRGADYKSGLWIEYWNGLESSVVGQWIRETGSLELATDERLVEVTTWSRQESHYTARSEKIGKILGVGFATSSGRHVQFLSQPVDQSVAIRCRATPFEELVRAFLHADHAWLCTNLITTADC